MNDTQFHLPLAWPCPFDVGAADRLAERFAELGRAEARLAARPPVAALLRSLGGNSPYLADLAVREAASLRALVATGPDALVATAMAELAAIAPAGRRDRIAAAMRRTKRIVALATAIADIGGIWPLERVTAALSDLAEGTLSLAMATRANFACPIPRIRLAAVGSRSSAWVSSAPVN
jgi:glutamate-ammonia-ligase adenylyltransferase